MTVLEPTPDRGRRSLLRRVCFTAIALALTAAFAFTLSGIATTRGAIRPDGQAAAIAAQQRLADGSAGGVTRHRCHRGDRARSAPSSSGRV